jgi:hypothetical protein
MHSVAVVASLGRKFDERASLRHRSRVPLLDHQPVQGVEGPVAGSEVVLPLLASQIAVGAPAAEVARKAPLVS